MACRPAPPNRPPGEREPSKRQIKAEIKATVPGLGALGARAHRHADGGRGARDGDRGPLLARCSTPRRAGRHLVLPSPWREPRFRKRWRLRSTTTRSRLSMRGRDSRCGGSGSSGEASRPKSELRWQALAASLDLADVRDLVPDTDKGCAFVLASNTRPNQSRVRRDRCRASARTLERCRAGGDGRSARRRRGEMRTTHTFWATLKFLAERLPDSDPDGIAFTRVLRSRAGWGTS